MRTTADDPGPPSGPRRRVQDVDGRIGARLRQRRLELGLTQQRLAELVGVSYQQVHKYETGETRIVAGRLHALARALGVRPGYFFEGLEADGPAAPTARQGLELAGLLAALPRRPREAMVELARVVAERGRTPAAGRAEARPAVAGMPRAGPPESKAP